MPSTAQRAALARAAKLLPIEDRNLLTQHGRLGISGVMDFLRVDKDAAERELARVTAKLQPLIARELCQAPEGSSNGSAPAQLPAARPLPPPMRSAGQAPADAPVRRRKPATYKVKACVDCHDPFTPKGPRQTKCEECGGGTRAGEPRKTTPSAPPPAAPSVGVESAALDAAGVEHTPAPRQASPARASEYVSLRDELTAIQARLHSFAGRLDRFVEENTNPKQTGG